MAKESVSVDEAAKLLKDPTYKYVDVRTEKEFKDGHVLGAYNLPFQFIEDGKMVSNPKFTEEFEKKYPDKSSCLLLGCKGGGRSDLATKEMARKGYTALFNVAGGFDSWKAHGLPTVKN